MNPKWWRSDAVVAAVVCFLFLIVWLATPVIRSLESLAYDVAMSQIERTPAPSISVIAIDQQSLDNLGRWPWSREIHVKMIAQLQQGGAQLIVPTIFFTEPQRDRGLDFIEKLAQEIAANPDAYPAQLNETVQAALQNLNVDRLLAEQIGLAGNVLIPMMFTLGEQAGEATDVLPDFVARQEVEASGNAALGMPQSVIHPVLPISEIGQRAKGVAALNLDPDADGVVRRTPLALRYYDAIYPSFLSLAVAKGLNIPNQQISVDFGRAVSLGGMRFATDPDSTLLPHFYAKQNGQPAFQVDSFYDVIAGKIPASKYRGQIVLIGATAPGIGAALTSPVQASNAPVEIFAHNLSAMLSQHYYTPMRWSFLITLSFVVLVAAYLALILPRLRAKAGAVTTTIILLLLILLHYVLMRSMMIWQPLMAPACLLVLGHLALTTKRFLWTEAKGEQTAHESAESNRMLGLAFQGQGQLDMAFDKLRRVPLDDGMMEVMYNLGLDFERKRQFNKAESVYRLMAKHNPRFKDLPEKLKMAQQMAETVILGAGAAGGTMILASGDVEKPMLGRYQLEKELGKGAMGVVYLGKDPKIGREVAIKTLALSKEFEADLLDEARQRFFRVAETAGKLNHPNIVTIFDAGEEHDLAYIAMEFLPGEDLIPFTRAAHLMPILEVIQVVKQVALALDYAHKAGVVHRDIKPANVMYDRGLGVAKVTDFGIARITDSSKTKTGMVLGTPSFMSPEQLAGKHIDGRSDLFSLGVMLYQLLTGHLPFVGSSMAELMYRITQQPPTDPRQYTPKMPAILVKILLKSMEKDINQRFQTGAHFAQVLAKLELALKGVADAQSSNGA